MSHSIALNKSEAFGVRIIDLYEYLKKAKAPFPIIEQITKSGTSIGANLSEAICGISDKDFLAKAYISLKECSETRYWLRILNKSQYKYLPDPLFESLYSDADELFKILTAITKTLSQKLNTKN